MTVTTKEEQTTGEARKRGVGWTWVGIERGSWIKEKMGVGCRNTGRVVVGRSVDYTEC